MQIFKHVYIILFVLLITISILIFIYRDFVNYKRTVTIPFINHLGSHPKWNKLIPNTIYQTYKSNEIPYSLYNETIKNIWDLNTNCKYEFYSDERIKSFLRDEYNQNILNTFNKLTIGAAKGDLIRYLLLYKYGGIYCDLDNVLIDSFDNYLNKDDKFVVIRNTNKRIDMHIVCVIPKHPLLKNIIDQTLYNINHYKGQKKTGHVTGPFMYRPIIYEYMKKHDDIRIVDEHTIMKTNRIRIKQHDNTYVYWGSNKKI